MTQAATAALLAHLEHAAAVRVTVLNVLGSGPREPGAWMAVLPQGLIGSVGGGHLEFEAIAHARRLLAGQAGADELRFALGPALGQCCGGVVVLGFKHLGAADVPALRTELQSTLARDLPVALFGGGHVGKALVQVFAHLPVNVNWFDSRDEIFPTTLPPNVQAEHSEPVHGAVAGLAAASNVLILSFSHAEDLDVLAACLARARERDDLPFIGLIGSASKWASFRHRLEARGFGPADFARVTSPIGVPGVVGKEPEVIAVAVAAQLMMQR